MSSLKNNFLSFSKEREYSCNLNGQELIDYFDKGEGFKNIISYQLYIKRRITNNSLILNRRVGKTYEAQDIEIKYDKNRHILNIKIRPVLRSYALFTIIPLSIFAIYNGDNLSVAYYFLPVVLLAVLILFFKYLVNDELHKVDKEFLIKFAENQIRAV